MDTYAPKLENGWSRIEVFVHPGKWRPHSARPHKTSKPSLVVKPGSSLFTLSRLPSSHFGLSQCDAKLGNLGQQQCPVIKACATNTVDATLVEHNVLPSAKQLAVHAGCQRQLLPRRHGTANPCARSFEMACNVEPKEPRTLPLCVYV